MFLLIVHVNLYPIHGQNFTSIHFDSRRIVQISVLLKRFRFGLKSPASVETAYYFIGGFKFDCNHKFLIMGAVKRCS